MLTGEVLGILLDVLTGKVLGILLDVLTGEVLGILLDVLTGEVLGILLDVLTGEVLGILLSCWSFRKSLISYKCLTASTRKPSTPLSSQNLYASYSRK